MNFLLTITFALLLQSQLQVSDKQTPVAIQRISSSVTIDGIPDENAWKNVKPFPLVMYQPVYGGDMSNPTIIKVAYDDKYLYVAGELYDSEPEGIVATNPNTHISIASFDQTSELYPADDRSVKISSITPSSPYIS
ncbi:hypothetical protein [Rhodohalobacter sp. 8-1]|uniref:hypothetical protein n=1 Tax=Rhodohalobacter sp. 8-1 TaxID=3131972 RepID=UPI0030EFA176